MDYTPGTLLPFRNYNLKAEGTAFYLVWLAVENDGIENDNLGKFLVFCTQPPEKAKKYKFVIRRRFESGGTATYEGPVYSIDQPRSDFTSNETFGFFLENDASLWHTILKTITFCIDHA